MTPGRLDECLDLLDWTQRGLARRLERPEGTVRQWRRGIVEIPPNVERWLETLVRLHERNPAPRRGETVRGLAQRHRAENAFEQMREKSDA